MSSKIYTKGKIFLDNKGRERIFNGVNICDKNSLFLDLKTFNKTWNDKDIKYLKDNGFNLIRIGFTWDAIEPEIEQYNEEYLKRLDKAVKLCEKYKIYFYLDCHQDLFSKRKSFGDGAPKWATLDDGEKYNLPLGIWAEGYFYGKSTMNAFENFWKNKEVNGKGLIDRYASMWKMLAKRYCNSPYLFGFDVLNEPYPGKAGGEVFINIIESSVKLVCKDTNTPYKDLGIRNQFKKGNKLEFVSLISKLLNRFKNKKMRDAFLDRFEDEDGFHEMVSSALPYLKKFDEEYYTPFLNKIATNIREVAQNGIILMENSYYSNLGIPYSAKPVEVNGKREECLAFSPHGYDIFVDSPLYNLASNERILSIFKEHKRSQERLNMPVVVGEFGGCSNGKKWLCHIDYIIDIFNSYKWSCTYWVYTKNMFNKKEKKHFVRPYPQAICGDINYFNYDRNNNHFNLKFTCDKDYGETKSVVFLHKVPQKIYTDVKYRIKKLGTSTYSALLDSTKGEHTFEVYFA